MMKKKWSAVALSLVMAVSLAGCSGEISNEYITIKQYKELEVAEVEKTEVTDEKVESTIQSYLSAAQSKTEITDRAAEEGDTVDIDYTGMIDDVAFDGGTASGASLVLGSGQFIGAEGDYKGFEEQIVGHKTGDEFDIMVQFPEEYSLNTDLAGKPAKFHIKLNGIYQMTDQELTDEWVKTVSEESETVEEFRKEIRGNMEKTNEENYTNTLKSEVLEALLEQVEVKELPEDKINEQYQGIEENYTSMAESYGMEFADFLTAYMGMTEEDFKTKAQEAAELAVKRNLACELLAEKKNLEPSDKEYEEKIQEYAEQSGFEDADSFKETVGEDVIKSVILQDKVAEYLAEHCIQVETSTETQE